MANSQRITRRSPRPPKGAGAVVLVEFVAQGRFILGIEFPFIHAWLKRRGVPVRWIRLVLPPAARSESREQGMPLGTEDLEALLERMRGLPVRHILFSFPPASTLWRRLLVEHPSADGRFLCDGGGGAVSASGAPSPLGRERDALARWLDLRAGSGPRSPMSCVPDFGFIAGNPAARGMAPLAFILAGEECVYRRSVRANPVYAGVDLSGCRLEGCAFCVSGGSPSEAEGVSSVPPLMQIRAFQRTHPLPEGPRARIRLRIAGQKALLQVERLAAGLGASDLPPADLLFDARVDDLLRSAGRIGAAVRRLRGSGHKVHVCLVGLENLSAPELARMNKGIAPAHSLEAVRLLKRLEREHPEGFSFSEHGGLSTILFTPWTTFEDLSLNLALADLFGLERVCGKLLESRLRLYPGLPLTALARRDGLLVERYDDPVLDTARRNFYPDELPWRFREPGVEAFCRVALRLPPDPALRADRLYARVQGWASAREGMGGSRLRCARLLLERALRLRPGFSAEDLLDAEDPPGSPPPEVPAGARSEAGRCLPLLLAAQREGLLRVSRLEALEEASARELRAWVRRSSPHSAAVSLRVPGSKDGAQDLFFGRRLADVQEAASLTLRDFSGRPPKELVEAKRRLGELYGYPPCCARAYAGISSASVCMNEWLLLLRRCETPGPVDPLLTPFTGLISHIPCSARCRRSAALSRALLGLRVAAAPAPSRATLEHPVLFLLDRIGEYLELIPRTPVGRRFEFTAGALCSSDPDLDALSRGGTLEVREGLILAEREGRTVARFPLRAALWWHAKAFDAEFWRECALEALGRREEASTAGAPPRAPEEAARSPSAQSAALAGRLRRRLSADGGSRLGAFKVLSIEPGAGRQVQVTLGRGGDSLVVYVEPRAGAGSYFKEAGGLAFSYASSTPLSSPEHLRAFAGLVAVLARP